MAAGGVERLPTLRPPRHLLTAVGQAHRVPTASATANEKRRFRIVSSPPRPSAVVSEYHCYLLGFVHIGVVERGLGVELRVAIRPVLEGCGNVQDLEVAFRHVDLGHGEVLHCPPEVVSGGRLGLAWKAPAQEPILLDRRRGRRLRVDIWANEETTARAGRAGWYDEKHSSSV